ncbi:MAG: hypothetical protein AB1817_00070 [Chloroflexota bacterium]
MSNDLEHQACTPRPLRSEGFNPRAELPYGLQVEHIRSVMGEFLDFLGFINQQLASRNIQRLETMLMPANFSGIVGEFMAFSIPRYCTTLAKNRYHNGHPDLIPAGMFENNAVQYTHQGIEIKASRYLRGWQGHNPENIWLMVFVFDSNRPVDPAKKIALKPFQFVQVVGAQLTKRDWIFSGRSGTSRRTITASVTESGYRKMMRNWIYKDSSNSDG